MTNQPSKPPAGGSGASDAYPVSEPKINVDDNGIITDADGNYVTQMATIEPYTPSHRLEALRLAQDLHSKSGAFEAIKPGAPDVVKTAENFYKFLEGEGYDTTIPERADRGPVPERKNPNPPSDDPKQVTETIVLD